MANNHDFKDDSGLLSIVLSLVILVGMTALPATIGWYQVIAG